MKGVILTNKQKFIFCSTAGLPKGTSAYGATVGRSPSRKPPYNRFGSTRGQSPRKPLLYFFARHGGKAPVNPILLHFFQKWIFKSEVEWILIQLLHKQHVHPRCLFLATPHFLLTPNHPHLYE